MASFSDKLSISPEGITWKNKTTKLEDITDILWGGTKEGFTTKWTIKYATKSTKTHIEIVSEEKYQNFISKLYRAVGIRLLMEKLESFSNGYKFNYGNCSIHDSGVTLEKKHLFSQNEKKFFPWREVSKTTGNGCLYLFSSSDPKFTCELSFLQYYNLHIVAAALNLLWENSSIDKLSDLLN